MCAELGWPLLDKDDARDALQEAGAVGEADASPVPGQLSAAAANAIAYDCMFAAAATQLSLGLSVALDCPFARRSLYDRAAELAARVRAHAPACTAKPPAPGPSFGHSWCLLVMS